MIDDGVTERLSSEFAVGKPIGGFGQRAGHGGDGIRLVDIPIEVIGRFDLVVDAIESGGECGGIDEVRVAIGTRDPAFDSQRLTVSDDSEPGGAVVVAPGAPGRSPAAGLVAFVGIDGWGQQRHEFGHVFHVATQEVAEGVTTLDRPQRFISGKRILAIVPETDVHMAAGPGLSGIELGHEADGCAGRVGGFLEALLEQHVSVGHFEYRGVSDIEFVLSQSPFALGVFDRDT